MNVRALQPLAALTTSISVSLFATLATTTTPARSQSIVPAADGTATLVTPNGQQYNISGGSLSNDGANLFHSFQEFGLSQGEIANFLANPQLQNILGRVTGGNASIIDGVLQISGGNPNLYLMNPSGIIFGPNASLNLPASFTATTADRIGFANGWFNATGPSSYGDLVGTPNQFAFTAAQPGSIVNAGDLAVSPGQSLTLLGGTVVNTGSLSAPEGQITIAAIPGESLVRVSQPGMALNLEIDPLQSQPTATPHTPSPTPLSLPALLTEANFGNAAGVAVDTDGTVHLTGSGIALPTTAGTTVVSGSLNAASATGMGGEINVLGQQVALFDATLNASGETGGGTVLVGGDYLGQGNVPNALHTYGDSNSVINVDALTSGDGGRAIVWADDTTRFFGSISARGGALSGNGGFIETSGKNYLEVFGIQVDASAPNGIGGEWLLDPRNVIITNVTAGGAFSGGNPDIFTPTADDATVAVADILAALAGGFDVTITTGSSGGQDGDITVAAPINAATVAGNLTLTLDATNDIFVNADIINSDTVNTHVFNVVLDAGGDITTTGSTINTSKTVGGFLGPAQGGNVTFTAGGNINAGTVNTSATSTAFVSDAFGGDVSFTAEGSINVGLINTSASSSTTPTTAQAGNVSLIAGNLPGSNITFSSINATGTAPPFNLGIGGTVQVLATGTVQGTGTLGSGATIDTVGTTTNGNVTIQHDGGPNNVPFVIGDASQNGLAGSINGSVLASGSFPVLANGGSVSPAGGITITSINTPPTLTASNQPINSSQSGVSFSLTSGAFTFTLAQFLSNSDTNLDNVSFIIDALFQGTLTRNGVALQPGDTVALTDTLVYTPPDGVSGNIDGFSVKASDNVSSSTPQTLQFTVESAARTFGEDTLPREKLPEELEVPLEDILALQVYQAERKFTADFEQYFGTSGTLLRNLSEIREHLRTLERETGVKAAILYAVYFPATSTTQLSSQSASAASPYQPFLKTLSRAEFDQWQFNSQGFTLSQAPDIPSSAANPQANDQLELLLVTGRDQPIQRVLPGVTRQQIQQETRFFVRELADLGRVNRRNYLTAAEQLYDWLVAPVEPALKEAEIDNIVFVMDEGLRSLPLAALHDGNGFIVERYSVGLMPSMSLSDTRYRDIRTVDVLAMGAERFLPTQEQPPLPAVPVEVNAIANELWKGKAYLNEQFTRDRIERTLEAQPFGILHLATHADFRSGPPENSYIQLWDSRIFPAELRELGLGKEPPVELLILSACRTAFGSHEAELGFAGLGVQSGAKSALGSFWYVNDEGTTGLMTSFYAKLKTARIKAEALQQAQLAMLRGEVKLDDEWLIAPQGRFPLTPELKNLGERELTHPYFWSAFMMVGNPW